MFKFDNKYLTSKELKVLGIKCGKNCLVHETVLILNNDKLILGNNIRIDPFCNFINTKKIEIGSHTHIASYVQIQADKRVKIGNYSGIGTAAKIFTTNDNYSSNWHTGPFAKKYNRKFLRSSEIILKNFSVVAANSMILPGAVIQEGTAVGFNSFVNKKLNKWTVYHSINPLKAFLKRRKNN